MLGAVTTSLHLACDMYDERVECEGHSPVVTEKLVLVCT